MSHPCIHLWLKAQLLRQQAAARRIREEFHFLLRLPRLTWMAASPMPHPESIRKRLANREEREATVGYHRSWQIDIMRLAVPWPRSPLRASLTAVAFLPMSLLEPAPEGSHAESEASARILQGAGFQLQRCASDGAVALGLRSSQEFGEGHSSGRGRECRVQVPMPVLTGRSSWSEQGAATVPRLLALRGSDVFFCLPAMRASRRSSPWRPGSSWKRPSAMRGSLRVPESGGSLRRKSNLSPKPSTP